MDDLWPFTDLSYGIDHCAMSYSLTEMDKNVALSEFIDSDLDSLGNQNLVKMTLNLGI